MNLTLAAFAVTAPMAHVPELRDELTLDGPFWLAVQQQIYRGRGFVFGPVEVSALLTTVGVQRRGNPGIFRLSAVAILAYLGMFVVFFVFNDPVNRAFTGWTPATLPPDWPAYRLRWEIGHALAALLSLVALSVLVSARWKEACVEAP